MYDEIGKDTPYADVMAALAQARDAKADILIAIGAGSIIQGAHRLISAEGAGRKADYAISAGVPC
ncbi:MAG: iron-containing alcohol dehydrogenase [Xanthobacteraceae bacterium]